MTAALASFLVIAAAALLAAVIADAIPRVRLPVVVVEIALGIVVGPQVLDLAHVDAFIHTLSRWGLGFLFFLAGFELNFARIKGRPLGLGVAGWALSLGAAMALGGLLRAAGLVDSALFVGLAMATTAIGMLMPTLRDADELETRFGTFVVAAGAVGEFAPVLLMALVLNPHRGSLPSAAVLVLFALVAAGVLLLSRWWQPERIVRLMLTTLRSSAQVAVRLSIVLLAALAGLAEVLGLEFLLGTFAAGVIVAQAVKIAEESHPSELDVVRAKYEGLGFGFLIPIFFVVSGITFDLRALLSSPVSLVMLPVFVGLFLVVRGLPVMLLYRSALGREERLPLALLSGTELPVVIAITGLGVEVGQVTPATATAMVGAGMLSVLVFPVTALALRRRAIPSRT